LRQLLPDKHKYNLATTVLWPKKSESSYLSNHY